MLGGLARPLGVGGRRRRRLGVCLEGRVGADAIALGGHGHREAIVTLVEAGSDIALRDKQHESALDLAERRATCHAVGSEASATS